MSVQKLSVSCKINGERCRFEVESSKMLIDILRDNKNLLGTKLACDLDACGACTVLVNGQPFASCTTFGWQVDGKEVKTVEGLDNAGELDPIKMAFIENSAFQCGYCTPGMIVLARALLDFCPSPSRPDIRSWMSANICRCTGYEVIIEAIEKAAKIRSGKEI